MYSYDNMATTYVDNAMPYEHITSAEFMRPHPAYAYQEQMPAYNGTEDLSFVSPSVSQGTRSTYYEDSFPESSHEHSSPEAPSIERGNKLLSFQASTCNHHVLDYSMRQSSASLSAQLHGMFFLAESSRTGSGDFTSSPPELTCYRRNLFQITGSVTLPRMMQYAVTERGERSSIVSQELCISATESVEGSPVKIISVPWKTQVAGTTATPEEKTEKEPTSITLDQSTNHEVESEYSVVPIAWKRLQFRVATANNGRRKELQQHFIIKLSVMATLSNGSKVSLCDALSGPVIVRGRSPRNFQQRRDVPLSGSGASIRKSLSSIASVAPPIKRSSTSDSIQHIKLETGSDVLYPLDTHNVIRHRSSPGGYEWQQSRPMTAPISPYTNDSGRPSSSPLKRKAEDSRSNLSHSMPRNSMYDYRGPAPSGERNAKAPRSSISTGPTASTYIHSHAPVSMPTTTYSFSSSLPAPHYYGHNLPKTGGESHELITEYFQNGMEEWMPASDSLYRHHLQPTHIPPVTSVGGPAMGGRGYYGDDMA